MDDLGAVIDSAEEAAEALEKFNLKIEILKHRGGMPRNRKTCLSLLDDLKHRIALTEWVIKQDLRKRRRRQG